MEVGEVLFNLMDRPPVLLSNSVGINVSAARLFASMLYIYPIAIVQHFALTGKPAWTYHVYYTFTSLLLLQFNFGYESYHFVLNIILVYLLISFVRDRKLLVILSFVLNMGYLLVGYMIERGARDAGDYSVTWTTPHCVLTLKLIGLTWEIHDKIDNKMGGDVKFTLPSLLDVFGFASFTPAFLTGPQINLAKYIQLTEGEFDKFTTHRSKWVYALLRLSAGLIFTLAYPFLHQYVSTDYIFMDEYMDNSLLYRIIYLTVWGAITISRYIGVWLIAEGSCVISGISYNGVDKKDKLLWNGSANVKLTRFYITSTESNHLIQGFNINTNSWVLMYVYKRLRFLNNKQMSQFTSLLFLAVWHGLNSGYFFCFFMEFIIMNGENGVKQLFTNKKSLNWLYKIPGMSYVLLLISKFICTFTLSYSFACFEMLDFTKWWHLISTVAYLPTIVYMSWFIIYPVLNAVLP